MKIFFKLNSACSAFFFLFLLLLFLGSPAFAWQGTVISVHDGDTLTVVRAETGKKVKIRLAGIDAPELATKGRWQAQPYAKEARDHLRKMLPVGTRVSLVDMGLDKYHRTIAAVVALPDGSVAQEEMLNNGLAWVYRQYCKNCPQWLDLEKEALQKNVGLWEQEDPVPPWSWRSTQKVTK